MLLAIVENLVEKIVSLAVQAHACTLSQFPWSILLDGICPITRSFCPEGVSLRLFPDDGTLSAIFLW
jgi:hypothetical protein